MDVLRRRAWTGRAVLVGIGWQMRRTFAGRARHAACEAWTHQLGWELRLVTDGGEFQRSQVCQSAVESNAVMESWRGAMADKGWM